MIRVTKLTSMLVGEKLPHEQKAGLLLLADTTLDHPQIWIFHSWQQHLLGYFLAHFFADPISKLRSSRLFTVLVFEVLLDIGFV